MSGEEAAGKDMLSPAGTTRASIPLGGVGDSTDTGQEGTVQIGTPAPICRWLRASQGCSLPALLCLSLQSAEQTWVAKQTLRKRALGAGNWMGLVCPEILRVKGCRWGPTIQVTAFFLPPCRETLSLFQDPAQSTTSSGKPSPNAPGRTRMRLLPATFACLPRALLSFICQMFLQRQLGARHRLGL